MKFKFLDQCMLSAMYEHNWHVGVQRHFEFCRYYGLANPLGY